MFATRQNTFRVRPALGGVGLVVLGLLLGPGIAAAHQSSVVYSEITVAGREVDITLQITNSDLYQALALDKDRAATLDEARAGASRLTAYLAARVAVENHGHACPGEADEPEFL